MNRQVRQRVALAAGGVAIAAAVGVVTPSGMSGAVEVDMYPRIEGGVWTRTANLKDHEGNFQARQEHSAVTLNNIVYLIGGFIPLQPPPTPTEEDPEPFRFTPTAEVLAYIPAGHPAADGADEGRWISLDQSSWFPHDSHHHMMAVAHQGSIYALGGHAGVRFFPDDAIYMFTPEGEDDPNGTWSGVRVSDGGPCDPASEECLRLPEPRAAGAAVSAGDRIYVIGGVVPNPGARDPVNESIRTTTSVIYLDTSEHPLEWRAAPPLLEPREHFNAVVVDDRIWVLHGRNEVSTHLRAAESYTPDDAAWRREPDAPVGTSANVLAAIGECVYSFGGELIASNVTGTVTNSQVFHVPTRTWRLLDAEVSTEPYDAGGATSKHGTYGLTFEENGTTKIMAPGGANLMWFAPMSRVHVFTPPESCTE